MKVALIGIALSLLVAGAINYYNVSHLGFPDGHLTQYEMASKPVLTAVSIIQMASILPFITVALRPQIGKTSLKLLIVGVLLLILSLFFQYGFVPFFFRDYLRLDNGQGG